MSEACQDVVRNCQNFLDRHEPTNLSVPRRAAPSSIVRRDLDFFFTFRSENSGSGPPPRPRPDAGRPAAAAREATDMIQRSRVSEAPRLLDGHGGGGAVVISRHDLRHIVVRRAPPASSSRRGFHRRAPVAVGSAGPPVIRLLVYVEPAISFRT
jgi:hypothetical protein